MAYYATLNGNIASEWSTPDAAPIRLTDHHDLRVLVAPALWNPASAQALLTKWDPTGNQRAYYFGLNNLGSTGLLELNYSTTGSNNLGIQSPALPAGLTSQTMAWVRVVYTANVAGQAQCFFYYSTDGSTWTAIGGVQQNATPGPVFNSTALLRVGGHTTAAPLSGKIYRAQVWDASGPTKKADFDVRHQASVATFTASTGEVWTPGGSAAIGVDEFFTSADFGPGSIPVGSLNATGLSDGLAVQAFGGSMTARRAVPYYRALDYGVKQDVIHITDAAATAASHTISSASSGLGTGIKIGMTAMLQGAGAAGANLSTTVTSVTNLPHSFDVAAAVSTTVSGQNLWVGTDDTAAFNALKALLPVSSATPQSGVGGNIVLESGSIMGLAGTVVLDDLYGIRIEGQGGVSDVEGGAFGTQVVTFTPGMTAFRSYTSGGNQNQNGPQFADFNITDAAGGSVLIDTKQVNRVVLENMTLRKALVGFRTDANALDSAWHYLKQIHFRNCTTGWSAPDCFGGEMHGGSFNGCQVSFDGVKDRQVSFVGVSFDLNTTNAIGMRSRGYGLSAVNIKMENSGISNAMVFVDIDAFAPGDSPPWGAYVRLEHILIGGGGNSASGQYGIKLGSGVRGAKIGATISAIPIANRFVDAGNYNDAWISTYDGSLSIRQHAGLRENVGSGTPNGVVSGNKGDMYRNRTGGANSTLYYKTTNGGNTGWIAASRPQ